MDSKNSIINKELKVINIGTSIFQKELTSQGVKAIQVEWTPPARGNIELFNKVDHLLDNKKIENANKEAFERIKKGHPFLIGMDKAVNVIPEMHDKMILHSGPPIEWEDMAGPVQGAVIGALIYEGLANNNDTAIELILAGEIEFSPANEHNAVGPMAGIISASMPVHIIENKTFGNKAYCTVNEGLGKVLRFGANSEEVIKKLKWIENTLLPVMQGVLSSDNALDLKSIISQALHMGDECHNRNKASTSLFYREISEYFFQSNFKDKAVTDVLKFIKENEHYFLNLSMPACKSVLDATNGIKYSTIVTTMARNGVDFGIRISGMDKNKWFTSPANQVQGMFFPGYTREDAALDLGDSTITETMGIGGFAMGAAPAIVQFVGGEVQDAINYSRQMYEITTGENNNYSIPTLNFRGGACGIDIRKVVESNILPVINTGIAHKKAGIGQIGAGIVHPPIECFEKAIEEFYDKYKEILEE